MRAVRFDTEWGPGWLGFEEERLMKIVLPGGRPRIQVCRWIARGYILLAPLLSFASYLEWSRMPSFPGSMGVGEAALLAIRGTLPSVGMAITLALTLVVWLEPRPHDAVAEAGSA